MAACRLSFRLALIALGLVLFAGIPPAWAQSLERQETSVHPLLDNFVAYLKSETQNSLREAARLARENQDLIDEAKSRLAAQIDALRAALSGQKEHLETFGEDAAGIWQKFRDTAVASLSVVEQHALSALDWVMGFMRGESQSSQRPEIPV
jgi:DNA anti-recombination protein RmuC